MKANLSPSEYAKYKLILAAIHLFAEHGVDSVSLRMINREAGHKNNSALHYHFGSKLGLIAAVDNFIQQHFDEIREPRLLALEQRAKEGTVTLREAVEVFTHPYVEIIESYDWGYDAVRTIARMEFDSSDEVHALLSQSAGETVKRFSRLKRALLPDLTARQFKMRHHYMVSATVHSFADYRNRHMSYQGDLSVKELSELARFKVDMSMAILTAPE